MSDKNSFGSQTQLQIRLGDKNEKETAATTIKKSQSDFLPGVDRYAVDHDFLVHLTYPGRIRAMQFDEYVAPYRFPMYVDRSTEGEPILIVRTKGKVADDFIKRMSIESDFLALERQIDFQKLRPQIEVITGGWFGQMSGANIKSTAVFGSHVDKSDEFIHAERHGKLQVIYAPYKCNDSTYPLSIHSNGGVVLYGSFDTEEEGLSVVLHVKRNLLDACWAM